MTTDTRQSEGPRGRGRQQQDGQDRRGRRASASCKHPKYKKYVTRADEVSRRTTSRIACDVGDRVVIVETRPLSTDKRWRVSSIVEKASRA